MIENLIFDIDKQFMLFQLHFLTLTIISLVACLNYTEYTAFTNPDNNYTKAVFSPDYSFAIFYGPTTDTVASYSPTNWTKYSINTYLNFTYPCTDIQSYIDISGYVIFFYSSSQGDIRKRTYQTNGGYIDGYIWTLNDTANVDIVRVMPSQTADLYAVFCRNNSNVYTASLDVYSQPPTIYDFSAKGIIISVRWKELSSQLAISGGNTTDSRFFILYDVNTNTTKLDLTNQTSNFVLDTVFNSDGSIMYFIEQSTGQQNIQIYEFASGNLRSITVFGAQQLIGMGLQGNFLTVYDSNNVYVWDLVGEVLQGTYSSSLKSSCLAPDGSQLIVLATTSSNLEESSSTALTVYKLCPSNQFYNATSNTCDLCQSPCLECVFSASRCGSCPNQTFLSPPTFVCAPCISNCLNCLNNYSCATCMDTYFNDYDSGNCLLCSGSILGCIYCYNKNQCQTCNTTGNWQLTPNLQCVCLERYVQVQNQCLHCPNNCLNCTNTTFCSVCDYTNYWTNTTEGSCVCQRGFYNSNDGCLFCWKAIQGCFECPNQNVCNSCQDGYTLNNQTKQCDLSSSSHTLAIILGTVGGVILLGGIAFLIWWRCMKKKDNKIIPSTMLVTEPLNT